jgi:hypothetical protein
MVKTGKNRQGCRPSQRSEDSLELKYDKALAYHERNEKAAARRVRPPYLSRLKGTLQGTLGCGALKELKCLKS